MIELDRFRVDFEDFTLGPLTFAVRPGERVALVGANGAGKSTTLRGLAGLLPRGYGGHARIAGREVAGLGPEVRQTVGLLPEHLLGFGWMTVAEHLDFLGAFYPTWEADYADALADRLGLSRSKKLANLSKGMRVKLSLVAAEAYRPAILLLDEPTSGIDPVMRTELLDMLMECAPADEERIVVFSTHILEDVERMAERVLLLREGRLIDDVRIQQLRSGSADPVARQLVARLRSA